MNTPFFCLRILRRVRLPSPEARRRQPDQVRLKANAIRKFELRNGPGIGCSANRSTSREPAASGHVGGMRQVHDLSRILALRCGFPSVARDATLARFASAAYSWPFRHVVNFRAASI